ncbi:MAG: glycosyl transferase family 1 [Firmicutes bacterium HGW-Firmicutes-8]|nr:MAG: glycosyl transferase family 1 [Firmicutes bacterium HGW-Firmicutes-8]
MSDYQVIWRGLVSHASGWGTACREYVLALDKLGVDVKIENPGAYLPETDRNRIEKLRYLINKPYTHDKTKVLVYHYHPYHIDLKKEREKFDHIILNTAWETTKIPNNWFPTINEFNAIFVPSKHNMEALKNSGVTVPVLLVPHGADTRSFNPQNEKMPLNSAAGKFIFISVFDFQHRKNPEGLLKAYWEEFKPDENVMLVVKTYWSGNKKLAGLIEGAISKYKKRLGIAQKNTVPLVLITRTIGKKELKGLYTLGNAFVLPTRGEGVGLPFIEALASGIPVIATGWGGQMEFLNESNAFLVDYKLENPVVSMKSAISRKFLYLFAEKGQLWAEPNVLNLRRQMRFAYENSSLCKLKGKQGREDMLKMSWDRAGNALKEAVEKVIKNTPPG